MSDNAPKTIKYPEFKELAGRFIRYCLSQYKIIVTLILIGGGIGLIYGKIQPSSFKATSTFIVEDKTGSRGGGLSGLASQFGLDLGGVNGGAGLFDGDNILELMRSRNIIEKVLLSKLDFDLPNKEKTLIEYYIHINSIKQSLEQKGINIKELNFSNLIDMPKHTIVQDSIINIVYNAINNNLNVEKKNKKSSIITLEYNSNNQIFSKYFVDGLIMKTSEMFIEIKTGNLSRSIDKIQKKADSLENILNTIYNKSFNLDNSLKLVNANPGLKLNNSSSEAVNRDKLVTTTLYTEVIKNLETLKLSLINQTPVIQILDTPKFPLYDQRVPARYFSFIGILIGLLMSIFFLLYKYTSK